MNKMVYKILGIIIGIGICLLIVLLVSFILAYFAMFFFNLFGSYLCLPIISYWQMFGLLMFIEIIATIFGFNNSKK